MSYDITESIPAALGGGTADSTSPQPDWDVTFNGLGFNLRPSESAPYQRGTEPARKQQIDTSESPGEQSLSSWWTRSQDTWDMGAGINWYEPGTEPDTYKRFANSQGVDVWTPGELKLLPKMTARAGTGTLYLENMEVGGVVGQLVAGDDLVTGLSAYWTSLDGSSRTFPVGIAATEMTRPAISGTSAWIGVGGGITHWTPTTPSTPSITAKWTCTGTPRAWWAKARLIIALGAELYELAPAAAAGALSAVGTLLYTHPDSEWEWVGIGETGGAILAAGRSGSTSGVFRITVEQDEVGQPVLSGASQVAHFPSDESIYCMGVYLGTFLVLGTNKGIRVGATNEQGVVQYGPITVPLSGPPADIAFDGQFAYVAVTRALPDGTSGLVRIDLSTPIGDTGAYPWAWDLSAGTTADVKSVVVGTDVNGEPGWYIMMDGEVAGFADGLVDSGWVDTGRVRFGTSEPKAFRLARLICDTNGGRVRLDATTPSGTEVRVIEFDDSFITSEQVAIQVPGAVRTHQYMSFKITLTRSPTSTTTSPTVNGLAIKAVPAAARVRLYQYPLSVFDTERNRNGEVLTSGEGNAYRRLRALEELEETGAPVTVRDNRTGETFTGQIDNVNFSAPHPPDRRESGFGGVASVLVRKL